MPSFVAPTADVSNDADIGENTKIWHLAQVRENASLGAGSVVGRGAYVDAGVRVGVNCKIQNYALVYAPAEIGDGVFIGPAAVLTNDVFPRAVTPDGELKDAGDWEANGVRVETGASIGAASVVVAGVTIGAWALVAAGAIVTRDVAPFALVRGVPARRVGWVGRSGRPLHADGDELVDVETGDRFRAEGDRLEEVNT